MSIARGIAVPSYDSGLDSPDVIVRQQTEIDALRTVYVALNSDSCGELDRLRGQLKAMTDSYEGQKRNTLAFMQERDEARAALRPFAECKTQSTGARHEPLAVPCQRRTFG